MSSLDEQLRQADPASRINHQEAESLVAAMTNSLPLSTIRKPVRRPGWRLAVSAGVIGALVLTGAAIVAPLVLGVNGEQVDVDVRIPITYETESGVSVSCTYGLYVSSLAGRAADEERLAEVLAAEDWTGIGQEIYDYAVAHPYVPEEGEVWTNDSSEVRAAVSFKLAVTPVITARLPADLRSNGSGWSSTDTCTGPFQ